MAKHPDETRLALYAGDDLGWWDGRLLARHLRDCDACAARVAAFRRTRDDLALLNEMPPEVHWGGLSVEMRANIRLGVEAGQAVAVVPARLRRPGWKPSLAMATVVIAALVGWLLYFPRPQAPSQDPLQIVLGATPESIEMRQGESALAVVHAGVQDVRLTVAGARAVQARYVDAETGNVTISHVYAE